MTWSPELVAALKWYLDRCQPHGNFKPCVHCNHTPALSREDRS